MKARSQQAIRQHFKSYPVVTIIIIGSSHPGRSPMHRRSITYDLAHMATLGRTCQGIDALSHVSGHDWHAQDVFDLTQAQGALVTLFAFDREEPPSVASSSDRNTSSTVHGFMTTRQHTCQDIEGTALDCDLLANPGKHMLACSDPLNRTLPIPHAFAVSTMTLVFPHGCWVSFCQERMEELCIMTS